MSNKIIISIYATPGASKPTHRLPDVPWYSGITALQAMVIGEAMYLKNFSFRVVYRSIFGAFVDSIDDVVDQPSKNLYWMLYVNGREATVGASEAVIQEDEGVTSAAVDWRYVDVSAGTHKQASLKSKALPTGS